MSIPSGSRRREDPVDALEASFVASRSEIETVRKLQQRAAAAPTASALSLIASGLEELRPARRPEAEVVGPGNAQP